MGSKGKPYRTVLIEDYEVLVGRSAADNDLLSIEIAEPGDLWLHVAERVAGSHVVVRNPSQGEIPHDVVRRAAELAAWYSKARNRKTVKVHYCRAGSVKKRRGAPAGQVEIRDYHAISVEPAQ